MSKIRTLVLACLALLAVGRGWTAQPQPRRLSRLSARVRVTAVGGGEVPANDPRGVTGRFSVFAPNATATVTVCEFRAGLKKNLGEFRTRGTIEERHERYQASTSYLDALASAPKGDASS